MNPNSNYCQICHIEIDAFESMCTECKRVAYERNQGMKVDISEMVPMLNSKIRKLEAENARLRELAVYSNDEGTNFYWKDYAQQLQADNARSREALKRICSAQDFEWQSGMAQIARDALAGPERELHISPELIMTRDEIKQSSFIGPSGAKLVWNEMKNDDALAGPENKPTIQEGLQNIHDAGGYAWDAIDDPKSVIAGPEKKESDNRPDHFYKDGELPLAKPEAIRANFPPFDHRNLGKRGGR